LKFENVIFSVGHTTDISSVWPINFQCHSQTAATGYSCVGYVKWRHILRLLDSSNI